jgi:PTS system fructose-specific IIC component
MSDTLRQYIRPEHIRLHLDGTDKPALIRELVGVLAQSGAITDVTAVEQAIRAREAEGSTGLHDGVAMPHCRSGAVGDLQVAIGLKREGADFAAADGRASRIFILLVCPERQPAQHLPFITAITRRLRDPRVCRDLARATSVPEAIALLVGTDA